MTEVLIMNGAAESGKGTIIGLLKLLFNLNIQEHSSIDYVKETALEYFEWDGKKDVNGRNLLSTIKQAMISYNDLPTKKSIKNIEESIMMSVDIVVIDIREPDEITKIVNYCKKANIVCHTCLVKNIKAEEKAGKIGLNTIGDGLYNEYEYDIIIENNGSISDLGRKVIDTFDKLYS